MGHVERAYAERLRSGASGVGGVSGVEGAMKYRETKTECAKGCGRKRRPGGRYCKQCHAEAMRAARRASAEEKVKRVVTRAVRPRTGMTAEMRAKVAALAERVARQIEELNGGELNKGERG